MSYTPNYVASYENDSGLFTYYEPFLIPEKAFPILEDVYCWRGRVKKRSGINLMGRLRRQLSQVTLTQQAAGLTTTIADLLADGSIDVRSPATGVVETYGEIQPKTLVVSVGAETFTDTTGDGTLTPGTVGDSGTINYVTGTLVLNFGVAIPATNILVTFFYFPSLPVLGLPTKEAPQNVVNDTLVAFDQKYAYVYLAGQFQEMAGPPAASWNTPDYSEFYSTNYWYNATGVNLFWTTNFNKSGVSGSPGDPIRYYDTSWHDLTPAISGVNSLYTGRIIVPYKNRLVVLNTWEGTTAGGIAASVNIPNRARFSWIGDPSDAVNGWLETPGHGGYIDAPTTEVIIGAEFIKDVLLVKFETSSWKLVYTGNNQLPFVWQKINTELGSESTFSLVPFDGGVYAIGNFGITTDDSVSVQRIDLQIPQQVFRINAQNDGVKRVSGVRDYVNELVYWAYPDVNTFADLQKQYFPNKMIVYNYANKTYALFNDSFTALGYFQDPSPATWASTVVAWSAMPNPWNFSNLNALVPLVCAGNQDGFVFKLDQKSVLNSPSLQIFGINSGVIPGQITIPNHNLINGSVINISGIIGAGPDLLNGQTFSVIYVDENTLALTQYDSTTGGYDNVTIPAGTYLGGGVASVVNNFSIWTKTFVPTYSQGMQCRIGYIDYLIDQTSNGNINSDIYNDENNFIPINEPSTNPSMVGSNQVSTAAESTTLPIVEFQKYQSKIWHRQFLNSICQNFQLNLYLSEAAMSDPAVYGCDFVLHAMVFYLTPNARLTQ